MTRKKVVSHRTLRTLLDERDAEIERLRGLLREVHTKHWPFLTDGLHERVYDAINGVTPDQPAAVTSPTTPD